MADVNLEQPTGQPDSDLQPDDESQKEAHNPSDPPKLPPCDQCRRRKVKCDGRKVPCERSTSRHPA